MNPSANDRIWSVAGFCETRAVGEEGIGTSRGPSPREVSCRNKKNKTKAYIRYVDRSTARLGQTGEGLGGGVGSKAAEGTCTVHGINVAKPTCKHLATGSSLGY